MGLVKINQFQDGRLDPDPLDILGMIAMSSITHSSIFRCRDIDCRHVDFVLCPP
jgi:hypothetical protein